MNKFILVAAGLLLIVSFKSTAQSSECLALTTDQSTIIPLRKDSNFFNCFIIEKNNSSKTLEVYAYSNNYQRQKISVFEAENSASNEVLQQKISLSSGANALIHQYKSTKVGIKLTPTNNLTTNKLMKISVRSAMGIDAVIIEIDNTSGGRSPTPPPVVECPHCVNPRSVDFPQLLATSSSASSCQGDMNPPEGAPDGFNINTHLQRIEKMKQAAQLAGLSRGAPSGNLTTMLMSVEISKAFLMSDMFAPGQPYDLKHNNAMKGSAEFGNWFYGAAANVFGYSESETLKAAAIVQQYQNFGDSNQELVDVGEMIAKMMWAAMTGQGDNPDDPAPISGGHAYNDVRKNDPDAAKKNNSCEDTEHSYNNKSSPSPSFGGAGISGDIDGGWGQGGYQYIGPGTCYACLSTHIVDLPRRMN